MEDTFWAAFEWMAFRGLLIVTHCFPTISRDAFPGDDAEPRVRERGDRPGRPADGDGRRAGQDHEELGPVADGVGAVPGEEGARDQVDGAADAGGASQGHPG